MIPKSCQQSRQKQLLYSSRRLEDTETLKSNVLHGVLYSGNKEWDPVLLGPWKQRRWRATQCIPLPQSLTWRQSWSHKRLSTLIVQHRAYSAITSFGQKHTSYIISIVQRRKSSFPRLFLSHQHASLALVKTSWASQKPFATRVLETSRMFLYGKRGWNIHRIARKPRWPESCVHSSSRQRGLPPFLGRILEANQTLAELEHPGPQNSQSPCVYMKWGYPSILCYSAQMPF